MIVRNPCGLCVNILLKSRVVATLPYCCHNTNYCVTISYDAYGSIAAENAKYQYDNSKKSSYLFVFPK